MQLTIWINPGVFKMGRSTIIKALEQLDKKDISSLILFSIFKLKEIPQYATLSELVYLLDEKSFSNLLNYFGGKTITIPTAKEFNEIVSALLILERKENTDMTEDQIFEELSIKKKDSDRMRHILNIVSGVVDEYDFKR